MTEKTGRNALCACGSGRKTKKCCGVAPKVVTPTPPSARSAGIRAVDGELDVIMEAMRLLQEGSDAELGETMSRLVALLQTRERLRAFRFPAATFAVEVVTRLARTSMPLDDLLAEALPRLSSEDLCRRYSEALLAEAGTGSRDERVALRLALLTLALDAEAPERAPSSVLALEALLRAQLLEEGERRTSFLQRAASAIGLDPNAPDLERRLAGSTDADFRRIAEALETDPTLAEEIEAQADALVDELNALYRADWVEPFLLVDEWLAVLQALSRMREGDDDARDRLCRELVDDLAPVLEPRLDALATDAKGEDERHSLALVRAVFKLDPADVFIGAIVHGRHWPLLDDEEEAALRRLLKISPPSKAGWTLAALGPLCAVVEADDPARAARLRRWAAPER